LNKDNEQKRKRIRELLTAIEEMKDGRKPSQKSNTKLKELVDQTKEEEMDSVLEKLQKSKNEIREWKSKAENYEKELGRASVDGKQNKNQMYETASIMDQQPPPFFGDSALMTPEPMTLPQDPGGTSSLREESPFVDMTPYVRYETPVDGGTSSSDSTGENKAGRKSTSRIPISSGHGRNESGTPNSGMTGPRQKWQKPAGDEKFKAN